MLIDTHCHLASHRFSADEVDGLIRRAVEHNVRKIVTLATSLGDVHAHLAIAEQHAEVHACIGIHPCDVHNEPDDAVEQLEKHAAHPKVAAVGETGLDYYHPAPDGWDEDAFRQRQREFLRKHFEMAARQNLNVVIHTRDRSGHQSFDDALSIYSEFADSLKAVFHCYIGTRENAQRVIALGGVLSFGGVATFKSAAAARETVAALPAGTFMLETDSPYLAPVPHRGQRNEPAFTQFTAECIAGLRGESLESLAAHTTATARKFFRDLGES